MGGHGPQHIRSYQFKAQVRRTSTAPASAQVGRFGQYPTHVRAWAGRVAIGWACINLRLSAAFGSAIDDAAKLRAASGLERLGFLHPGSLQAASGVAAVAGSRIPGRIVLVSGLARGLLGKPRGFVGSLALVLWAARPLAGGLDHHGCVTSAVVTPWDWWAARVVKAIAGANRLVRVAVERRAADASQRVGNELGVGV